MAGNQQQSGGTAQQDQRQTVTQAKQAIINRLDARFRQEPNRQWQSQDVRHELERISADELLKDMQGSGTSGP